jgi:DNA-binding response OmpR family regulator
MPQLGGFPVLEFLKGLENPPKVIMITANEGGRHKAYAEMLGVSDYLRKPFAMDVLLEACEKALTAGAESDGSSAAKKKAARKKAD